MKVLICGAGQLAFELLRTAPPEYEAVRLDRASLDITDGAQVDAACAEHRPDLVINAAAYTAVDRAESERDAAYAVNEVGAANLAHAAARTGAALVHLSTDFVFDGRKASPYEPGDEPNPLSVYGASKLAGERAVMAAHGSALVLRTAWVYSVHGNNFVKTMLRLMRTKPTLSVIADQVGTPTWARGLADAIWAGASAGATGMHHWTDAGVASWYDFAVAIQKLAWHKGMLTEQIPIHPIPTSAYPTPAMRPGFSLLNKAPTEAAFNLSTRHWQQQLAAMLDELKRAEAAPPG